MMKEMLITTFSQNWSKIVDLFKHGCKNDHGQLRATISCTCGYKFIGYKRQIFLDNDMYQHLQSSLCPCMVQEITLNKFA
jgi:hypothetical protein